MFEITNNLKTHKLSILFSYPLQIRTHIKIHFYMIILNTKLHDLGVFYQNCYFIFAVDFFSFHPQFYRKNFTQIQIA